MECPICNYNDLDKNNYDGTLRSLFNFFKNLSIFGILGDDAPPKNFKNLLLDNSIIGIFRFMFNALFYGMIMQTYYACRYDSKKKSDCFYYCPNCGHYCIQCNNCNELFTIGTKQPIGGKRYTCNKCHHKMALLPIDDDDDEYNKGDIWYYGDPNGTYWG